MSTMHYILFLARKGIQINNENRVQKKAMSNMIDQQFQ